MSEWWTYRLSDFLMFSPRTYWRMVELYNQQLWPVHWLALAVGLTVVALSTSGKAAAGRLLAMLLALAWAWVGWAFHWQRYAAINWSAQYLAAAYVLQALMLLTVGMTASKAKAAASQAASKAGWLIKLGWTLALAGIAYPLSGLMAGRPWQQAEVFGLLPEPTALVTLGLLLTAPHFHARSRGQQSLLLVIPALSLAVGAAMQLAMAG